MIALKVEFIKRKKKMKKDLDKEEEEEDQMALLMEVKEFEFSERGVYDHVILLLFLHIAHKDQNCKKSEQKINSSKL
jgi:hypothetical protein